MPNAFIAPYVAGVQSQVTCRLFDPRRIRTARGHYGRESIRELAQANSFFCPASRWPARGWLLLSRSDFNAIPDKYRTDFQLQLDDLKGNVSGGLTLKNLAIVQARCVSRGIAADSSAVYLVEVTDGRGVLYNPWAEFPTTSQYNVVAPAYPGSYYTASLHAGSPFTWNYLVQDLWTQMGAFLGAYPGLPSVPAGTPQNFIFPGTCAWLALNHILDLLGMQVAADLTQASPYTIVATGATDAAFTANQAKFAGLLEDDLEYLDGGSGRLSGKVVVYFHRENQYYGTEETVRNDSLQWVSTPLYSVTVNAPAVFSKAQGTHFIWDDFIVRYDADGNPLAADVTTASAIANERATQYYNRAFRGTVGYLRQVYAGALPFAAGAQVDGVRWFLDQRQGDFSWRTELIRGPQPPWPEVTVASGE